MGNKEVKIHSKFMNKISATFLLIIFFIFFPTSIFIVIHTKEIILEKNLEHSQFMVSSVDASLQKNFESIHQIIRQIDQQDLIVDFLEVEEFPKDSKTTAVYNQFVTAMSTLFSSNSSIRSIGLYKNKDRNYYQFSERRGCYYENNYELEQWMAELSESVIQRFLIEPAYYEPHTNSICYKVHSNLKVSPAYENVGVISFSLESMAFSDIISNYYVDGLLGNVYIVTPDGDILYDSSGDYELDCFFDGDFLWRQPELIDFEGKEYYINYSSRNEMDCIVFHMIPVEGKDTQLESISRIIFVSFFAAALLTLLMTVLMNFIFSKRIRNIMGYLSKIQHGNLSVRIPQSNTKDELYLISESINHMCEELEQHINQVYVAELQQKDAELKLKNTEIKTLQAQINPHFLYNTLEMIRMRLNFEGEHECAAMLLILSKLFRNSIKESMIVTLGEEIQMVKLFLQLYQLKYKKLQVEFDIEESILEYACIRSTFQPILENSVTHGYKECDSFKIRIEGKLKRGKIVFQISDNGRGIERTRLDYLNKMLGIYSVDETDHIGLFNVSNRLHLIFGPASSIYLKSLLGEGTSVYVSFDAKRLGDFKDYV